MTERQMSPHKVAVFTALCENPSWMTVKDVASKAGVARRTANEHLRSFEGDGLVEVKPLFGGYVYRAVPAFNNLAKTVQGAVREAAQAFMESRRGTDNIAHFERRRPRPVNHVFEAHDQHDPTKTYHFESFRDEDDTGVYLNFVEGDAGKDGLATVRDMMWINADQCEAFGKALLDTAQLIRAT